MGIADRVGTLEPGKMADVVLWSADPFSVYALAERVWIDGVSMWDRGDPHYRAPSDFLLGQPGQEFPRCSGSVCSCSRLRPLRPRLRKRSPLPAGVRSERHNSELQ